MADTRTVAVKLQADVNGYRTSMRQAAKSTTELDKAQEKAQGNARKWEAVGMASKVAGAAVAAGLLYATKAASNQEQAVGALTATFKVNSAQMLDNAKKATQLGLSITDYSNAAAKLGGQLSNLGVDQADLGAMTDDLVRKAADLAAQYGGTTLEAVDALGAAMRGEADPAERYSLALNATAVNAEMLATGGDKAQAILSLINKQMAKSGAAGAMAREFDTAASATQRAQAEFDNATAALGEALLPAMAKAAEAASGILNAFNGLSDETKQFTTYVVALGAAALLVGPKIATMTTAIIDLRAAMVASDSAAVAAAGKWGKLAASGTAVAGGFAAAELATDSLRDKLVEVTGTGGTAAAGAFDALKQSLLSVVNPGFALSSAIKDVGEGEAGVQQNTVVLTDAVAAMGEQIGASIVPLQGGADASYADAEAKENQAAAVKKAVEAFDAYIAAIDTALGLMRAQDNMAGMTDRLTESTKKYGVTLRRNTEAGRANREAIYTEIDGVKDLIQSTQENGGSLEKVNRIRRRSIERLRESAAAAGFDAAQVQELVRQSGLLKPVKTGVTVTGLNDAANDAERLASALQRVIDRSGLGGFGFGQARAAGGYVTGPGTGTSDSIPARLSNGEYVMTAKATRRIGVDRLDAMNYAGGGLVGYAAGGAVGGAGQVNMAVGAGRALNQVQKWREAVKTARQNVRDLREQVADYADSVANNVLSAGGEGLFDAFKKSDIAGAWRDLADAQDGVAAASQRLFDAQVAVNTSSPENRAAAVQELADAQRDLADAQSTQTAAEKAAADATPTAGGILGKMRERARLISDYASKVKALMSKGLSVEMIKELAGADPVEAGPVLDALLSMSAEQLKELGSLDTQARSAAASVGSAVAEKVNQKDLQSAEVQLTASSKGLDKSIKVADKTLDKKWRKVLANAGLSAEERVQFMQSLRDNDGKLTTYWRNVLAKAGLGAEERQDLLDGIDGADLKLTDHWRKKLAKAGLSAEDRGDLLESLAENDGKLTREWRDKLAKAGLSAEERDNLISRGILDADTKARVEWSDKRYSAALDADNTPVAGKFAAVKGEGQTWAGSRYAATIDGERAAWGDRIANVRDDARGWAGSRWASDIDGERANWGTRIGGVRDDARGWAGSSWASNIDGARKEWGDRIANVREDARQWADSKWETTIGAKADLRAGRKAAYDVAMAAYTVAVANWHAPMKAPKKPNPKSYGLARGGMVNGQGTSTSDSIPAMLSNGEFVIRAAAVSRYGADLMDAINTGRFASGGPVGFRTVSTAPANAYSAVTLATSGVPVVVQLDNRTLAAGQLKLRRQTGGTVTLGG